MVQASSPLFFRCVLQNTPAFQAGCHGQLCVCRCLWNLIFLDTCYQFSSRSSRFKCGTHNSIQLVAVPTPVSEASMQSSRAPLHQDSLLIYLSQSKIAFCLFDQGKENQHSLPSLPPGEYKISAEPFQEFVSPFLPISVNMSLGQQPSTRNLCALCCPLTHEAIVGRLPEAQD